jgi:anhydro-N-acetylmuramic acid kinase
VAGFMSGTSLDAVDAALILTDGEQGSGVRRDRRAQIRARRTPHPAAGNGYGAGLELVRTEPDEAFEAAKAVVTQTHAETMSNCSPPGAGPVPVLAGVHGQTVLHRRPCAGQTGATLQLIDAPAMQAALGMPLACDFRTADVAAGGQGAPLAPAYHAALMQRLGDGAACVLNLGGVANITAKLADGTLIAFDTGPAKWPHR